MSPPNACGPEGDDSNPTSQRNREAMVRWQGYCREQRSGVNSLFLTYAAALLGLQSSILLGKDVLRVDWPGIFVAAGVGALLSLTAGCVIVLVRLQDARLTARIARFRVEKKAEPDIDALGRSADKLGKWTNRLIPIQVAFFGLSALIFLTWLVLSFAGKLSLAAG